MTLRRQLRLALLRRHQCVQRHGLRSQRRQLDRARRAVRPHAGLLDHRRLRVSRQRDSRAARALRVRRFRQRQSLAHRARHHAHADADAGTGLSTGLQISSFAQDTDGELYIVHLGGTLHRLVQGAGGGPPDSHAALADRLRELHQSRRSRPADSFPTRPMRRSSPTARRRRAGWRCPTASASSSTRNNDFDFPNGSVLMKNFSLGGHAGRDAPVHAPQQRQLGRLHLRVERAAAPTPRAWSAARPCRSPGRPGSSRAKRSACSATPRPRAARSAWRSASSMATSVIPTGRTANQLTTLNGIDTLTPALTLPPAQLPVIPESVRQRRARARARAPIYIPIARNCHRPGGPTPSDLDFRYTTALGAHQCLRRRAHARRSRHHQPAADRAGLGGAFGGGGAHESHRAPTPCRRCRGTSIDTAGVQLLTDWMNGLPAATEWGHRRPHF